MKKRILRIVVICLFVFTNLVGYVNFENGNRVIAGWEPEIEISTDIGTEGQWFPSIATDGGKIHTVWLDRGDGDFDIYYRYNDGTSWQAELELSTDVGAEDQTWSSIAAEADKVHVVWEDRGDGDSDIYYKYYDGTSWQPELELSTDIGTEDQRQPSIAAGDGKVHVVWTDWGDGDPDIYYRYYNGTSWQPELELSTDVGTEDQGLPSIAADGGKLHLVWEDKEDGDSDIYYRHYDGTSWQPELELSTDVGTEIQFWSSIGVEGDKVHVVWTDQGDGDSDIYYRYYDGTSWQPELELSTDVGTEDQWTPSIAAEGGRVHVTWVWENPGGGDSDIYYRFFNGTGWQPELELSMDIGTEDQRQPSIAAGDGKVHVVWTDWEDGDTDIYYRSFGFPDVQVTSNDMIFDPPSLVLNGTVVSINATIHNVGYDNATDVLVRFYNGVPALGNQIDSDQTIPFIHPFGGTSYAEVDWVATPVGNHNIYIVVDPENTIIESNETNNIAWKNFTVIDTSPSTLYIKAFGDDIILNWTQPTVTGLSYYLIYRSTSQSAFDFDTPWVNTSSHNESGEPGPIPLRTMWNDTGAASDTAPQEYYYTIRTVFKSGETSFTSRTVGKWTKTFPEEVSTFSLPLEPLESIDTYNLTNDMNAEYIKWMDTGAHVWRQHNLGDPVGTNNTDMIVGEGYEVKFSTQTNYTFTGMPGAMIIYDDDSGFSGFDYATDAKSLSVSIQPNGDVVLNWQEPGSMNPGDWYEVYYSNSREGFFGTFGFDYFLADGPIFYGISTGTHIGANAYNPGARLYYMVVPFNTSSVRGSSTYSIGIWTEEYLNQYDTFGIPLKMSGTYTADWYCDNIPNTVGMNFFIINGQRWCWHSARIPGGAFDPLLVMTDGYQISTSGTTKYTFIGV